MELIPAIDLLDGRVVRLAGGDYGAVTSYGDDPVAVARRWQAQGAPRLHLVDLDGARRGSPVQAGTLAAVIDAVTVPCQVAGGIRSSEDVERAFAAGADRVVLGSALVGDPRLAGDLVERHGSERIVAALDVRDGLAVGDGWVAGARGQEVVQLTAALADVGITWFAVTAIVRDGLMSGPDMDLLDRIAQARPGARIIASGGIASIGDIRALAARGCAAAIVGRALYEGVVDLAAALAAAIDPPTREAARPGPRPGGLHYRRGCPPSRWCRRRR